MRKRGGGELREEVARRLRERPRPFRYITMDGEGEIVEVWEGPPAEAGAVNCIFVMLPREDGSHADPGEEDVDAAIARFVQRGGVIRRGMAAGG